MVRKSASKGPAAAKPPKMKKPTGKPISKTLTWLPNGDLAIVAWYGRDAYTVIVRGSKVIETLPAAPRARLIAELADGALLTASFDGDTRVQPRGRKAGEPTTCKTGFSVAALVGVRGVAYAGGEEGQFARFDEATGTWVALPRPGRQQVHSIVAGAAADVIVACMENIRAWNGTRWRTLGRIRAVSTLTRSPKGVLFGLGWNVVELGKPGKLPIEDGVWGSAWFDGALHYSSVGNVWRVQRGVQTKILERDGLEPYMNTMVSDGTRGAYISGKQVVVIHRGRATEVFG